MAPTNPDLRSEVQHFFEAFVAAFGTFSGPRIAERYVSPYVAVDARGRWRAFGTGNETGDYFQQVVTQYHDRGCRSCRFRDVDVLSLGTGSALATVTWELLCEDASVLSTWRESYTLVRGKKGHLGIAASLDHTDR